MGMLHRMGISRFTFSETLYFTNSQVLIGYFEGNYCDEFRQNLCTVSSPKGFQGTEFLDGMPSTCSTIERFASRFHLIPNQPTKKAAVTEEPTPDPSLERVNGHTNITNMENMSERLFSECVILAFLRMKFPSRRKDNVILFMPSSFYRRKDEWNKNEADSNIKIDNNTTKASCAWLYNLKSNSEHRR